MAMSTLHGKSRYERSALPAADQLDAHVDAREFLSIVDRYIPEGELLDALAEVSHIEYCAEMLERGHAWSGTPEYLTNHPMLARFAGRTPTLDTMPALVDYGMLSDHLKEQNRGGGPRPAQQARLAGLRPAPGRARRGAVGPESIRLIRGSNCWRNGSTSAGSRASSRPAGDMAIRATTRRSCIRAFGRGKRSRRTSAIRIACFIVHLPEIVTAAGMTIARLEALEPLRIGVTGHRVLADANLVIGGIEKALARIEASHPGRSLVVVSALAEGADRLVAEAVLRRPGARLRAVLPLPKFDYLGDFATPDSKEEFLRFLARTDEVVELPAQATRNEAYAAASDRVLDGVDVLVAVWDGKGAQGQVEPRRLWLGRALAACRSPGSTPATASRARWSRLRWAWSRARSRTRIL